MNEGNVAFINAIFYKLVFHLLIDAPRCSARLKDCLLGQVYPRNNHLAPTVGFKLHMLGFIYVAHLILDLIGDHRKILSECWKLRFVLVVAEFIRR